MCVLCFSILPLSRRLVFSACYNLLSSPAILLFNIELALWLRTLPIEGAHTDRNEAALSKFSSMLKNKMAGEESKLQQAENAKSTGQRREWKHGEHTKVGLKVLILYNDNQSDRNFLLFPSPFGPELSTSRHKPPTSIYVFRLHMLPGKSIFDRHVFSKYVSQ